MFAWNKVTIGVALSRQSWAAVRANPQLLAFPAISAAALVLTMALFCMPLAAVGGLTAVAAGRQLTPSETGNALGLLFLFYLVTYTLVIFSNTALVGATMKLLRGEGATVGDGIRVAAARLGPILVYALLSATIGVVARALIGNTRDSKNLFVEIVAALLAATVLAAWNALTFLVIPVLVAENVGAFAAMKRSGELFRQTWGEQLAGEYSIGGFSGLIAIGVIVAAAGLGYVALQAGSLPLLGAVVALAILTLTFVALIVGAVNGVYQASLYHYATTGDAGGFIDTGLVQRAFRPKGAFFTQTRF